MKNEKLKKLITMIERRNKINKKKIQGIENYENKETIISLVLKENLSISIIENELTLSILKEISNEK